MNAVPAKVPALIAGLMAPGIYPHPVRQIRLVETHISWVILTGDFAYKLKKPVSLGFLDFSTLERRRFYCEEEVRLNRRLAADYYLGVVPVTGSPEAPRFGAGPAIEYAVKMRQFPASAELDGMLDRGALGPDPLDAFAVLIADFHQQVAVATGPGYGDPATVLDPALANFADLRQGPPDPAGSELVRELEAWTAAAFRQGLDTFRRRKQEGFVRECHGDLHLRNLAWVDGRPLAFDCLEFSPELRWIDVMSEVAFLVMDLMARGQPRFAARFLDRYLERTGDYGGLAVLRFYLAYRAVVRAKVDRIRTRQPGIGAAERWSAEQQCLRYLALARDCTRPGQPRLIVTRGVSASGKTTVSQVLVEGLGAIRIRSDVERKRLFGLRAETSARAEVGEGIYAAESGQRTYARLLALAGEILDGGYPVVVDAAFLKASQRASFQALAAARGVPYRILEVTAPETALRARIVSRKKGASDADLAVLEHQLAAWQPLEVDEIPHAIRVDTEAIVEPGELLRRITAG